MGAVNGHVKHNTLMIDLITPLTIGCQVPYILPRRKKIPSLYIELSWDIKVAGDSLCEG